MKKLVLVTAFFLAVSSNSIAQSNLKPCEGGYSIKWTNCFGTLNLGKVGVITGEFQSAEKNSQGTIIYDSGSKYVGEFKNDFKKGLGNKKGEGTISRNGKGMVSNPDGSSYEGDWKDDKYDGQGTLILSNGDKYVGDFQNGFVHGKISETLSIGTNYLGQFKNDKRDGQGTMKMPNGDNYIGQWKNDLPNGQGTLLYAKNEYKGAIYIGEFKDGKRHGKGTFGMGDEKIIGIWENDKLIKDESPLSPVITLSCTADRGRMEGFEFQYRVNVSNNIVKASRGQSPSDVQIASTLIQFRQGDFFTTINRVTGYFSTVLNSNVAGSGTCVAIDQLKPKF